MRRALRPVAGLARHGRPVPDTLFLRTGARVMVYVPHAGRWARSGKEVAPMVTFSEAAREAVFEYIEQGIVEDPALRIVAGGSPLAPRYDVVLSDYDGHDPNDAVFAAGGFKVLIDAESLKQLEGSTLDYIDGGFRIERPATNGDGDGAGGELADRVRQVIETRINPAIASHGGQIALVEVRDDVAVIEMSGGCQGCGMARVTLQQGVEKMLKQAVPEIKGVADATDHAAGTDPYFQATP
ncbi:MAG: NifU family protein, partial [Gemmatimonadota bacterium]